MQIHDAASEFYTHLTYFKNYSKETVRRYRQVITFYANQTGHQALSEISQVSVQKVLMHGRKERSWSPKTFVMFKLSLEVFFRWCMQMRYMNTNPAATIETPKVKSPIPTKLTKQQATELLEWVYNYPYPYIFQKYRNHAIFAVALFCGLRKKEILELQYSDVDLENASLYVRQGKGNKERIVPMNQSLIPILRVYLIERKRLRKTCPQFFVSLNRNKGFTETGIKHLVNTIRSASGIQFTMHKLRHTFATLMLEGGCDIYSLSKMMGHNDITTTVIYLAASVVHLRNQIAKHPLNKENIL